MLPAICDWKGFCLRCANDILSELKQFKKEIGVPEVIICNGSGEKNVIKVKKYCGDIGTTLRILE